MKIALGSVRFFEQTNLPHISAHYDSRSGTFFFGHDDYHVALKGAVLFFELFDAGSAAMKASEAVTSVARLLANRWADRSAR